MPDRPVSPVRPIPGTPGPTAPRLEPTRPIAAAPEPTLAVNFRVEIDGRELAIARVSPLELAADPSGLKQAPDRTQPGRVLWTAPPATGRLILSRAIDGDRTLYQWRREALDGKPAVRDLAIRQLDRGGTTVLNAWQAVNAWPLRWTGPTFDAIAGGIAFEELELVFTDLRWL